MHYSHLLLIFFFLILWKCLCNASKAIWLRELTSNTSHPRGFLHLGESIGSCRRASQRGVWWLLKSQGGRARGGSCRMFFCPGCLTPPSKAAPRIRATFPCAASQPPPGLRVCWSLRQPKSCAVLGGCSPRPLGAVGSSSTPSTVGIGNQKGWSVRRVKYSYCFSSCACVAAEVESGQV